MMSMSDPPALEEDSSVMNKGGPVATNGAATASNSGSNTNTNTPTIKEDHILYHYQHQNPGMMYMGLQGQQLQQGLQAQQHHNATNGSVANSASQQLPMPHHPYLQFQPHLQVDPTNGHHEEHMGIPPQFQHLYSLPGTQVPPPPHMLSQTAAAQASQQSQPLLSLNHMNGAVHGLLHLNGHVGSHMMGGLHLNGHTMAQQMNGYGAQQQQQALGHGPQHQAHQAHHHQQQPQPQQVHAQQAAHQQAAQMRQHPHHAAAQQMRQHPQHHLDMLSSNEGTPEMIGGEGTTRKVAPRLSDLFRVGPSFSETRQHQEIYCKQTGMVVMPTLDARIDRGFEVGENGNWIGYKRNYFTLVLSFTLDNFDQEKFLQSKFYTFDKNRAAASGAVGAPKVDISYFAIRLVAKCSDDDVSISLIQHTAKRDKGPQFPPPIYPAVPGDLPDHDTVKSSCNKRNGNKIENMNKIFYFDRLDYYNDNNIDSMKNDTILKNYPSDLIAKVARFERIQFTSSIRVKSTTVNLRYFTLNVELLGIVEDEDMQIQPLLLSLIETPPLIIRGRSPSNYHKDKTSGYRGGMR